MCATCGWVELLNEIEELQAVERTGKAVGRTLVGIYKTVEQWEHCSPRQKEVIEQIKREGEIE
jgi:hypothetical protein